MKVSIFILKIEKDSELATDGGAEAIFYVGGFVW
jgi:hypothetical protein